jgi:hypothetical protein
MLNHTQLVVLTASFDFRWPTLVTEFFKTSEPAGEVATQIFSIDCFVNGYTNSLGMSEFSSPESFYRIFYIKLLMLVLLPFLLTIISFGVWWLISYKEANRSEILKTKAISTVVILLFFVHPNIVKQVFQTFYCLDIDGEQRLKHDLEV